MKALVTGAAGFIGSHLVEALIKRDYEVTCLVRKTSDLKWIEHLDIKYIFCDLADTESYADKINDFNYIFHLAGLTKAISEKDFFSANAENTKRLLQVISNKNSGIRRFVFLSSLAAVGPSDNGTPVREDAQPKPVSFYGASKLAGERAVLEYKNRTPVTILRPPAVYGPRDTDFIVMFKIIKNGIFPCWGRCCYSLLYIEDLVNGIILSAEKKEAEGGTFFLSDDMIYTNEDIAGEIASALGKKTFKIRLPRSIMPLVALMSEKIAKKGIINTDRIKDFSYPNWTCDAGKAKKEFGFKSNITLREGIKWTADWYKIHRWL